MQAGGREIRGLVWDAGDGFVGLVPGSLGRVFAACRSRKGLRSTFYLHKKGFK